LQEKAPEPNETEFWRSVAQRLGFEASHLQYAANDCECEICEKLAAKFRRNAERNFRLELAEQAEREARKLLNGPLETYDQGIKAQVAAAWLRATAGEKGKGGQ